MIHVEITMMVDVDDNVSEDMVVDAVLKQLPGTSLFGIKHGAVIDSCDVHNSYDERDISAP